MKGMRPLPYWNAPIVSWKKPGSLSKSRWPSLERGISSPHTRQLPRALTGLLRRSSNNTLAVMPNKSSASHFTIYWHWAARIQNDSSETFNMAYLAIRGSGAVNGVSRLHGDVSRHSLRLFFLTGRQDEMPVGYVTNGVHMPSWDSAESDALWTNACGKDRWLGTTGNS